MTQPEPGPASDERAPEDRDESWGDRRPDEEAAAGLRRLLEERPPHHGD